MWRFRSERSATSKAAMRLLLIDNGERFISPAADTLPSSFHCRETISEVAHEKRN